MASVLRQTAESFIPV